MTMQTGTIEATPDERAAGTIRLEDLADRSHFEGLPHEATMLRAIERLFGAKEGESLFALIVHNPRASESTFIVGFSNGREVPKMPQPMQQLLWEMLENTRASTRQSNMAIQWNAGSDKIISNTLKENDPNVVAMRSLQRRKAMSHAIGGLVKKAGEFFTGKAR